MKKIQVMLFTAVVALCANVFGVTVGDTVSYERNADRTSKIIRGAKGALTVIGVPQGYSCNGGTVVKLDYELDVLLKGKQTGDMGVCVPNAIFGSSFYTDLKIGPKQFGAFDLEHMGMGSATDTNGKTYPGCDVVRAMNTDHQFVPSNSNQAQVLWINHTGKIKYVTDLEITFKAAKNVKVLGAVEIDVNGISDSGISFDVGLDLK